MAVDSSTTIAGFDTAKPSGSDSRAEADDNFRHVKTVLKTAFAYIGGAVTASHTELNYVTGVTSAIQTQLNSLNTLKASLASPALTGTPTAPTATAGTSTTQLATTEFAQALVASVNATTGLTRSTTSSTSFSVSAGQLTACTSASAWAATFPASPTVGTVCGVASQNNLTTNTINFGANSVMGANGTAISGVLTLDQIRPVYQYAWYGDYWREA